MRKIAFIIQGNNKIGYGHVFRSLKIANQLNKKFVIEFFSINVEPLKFIRKYRSNYIKNINIIINFDYVIIDKLNTSQRLLKNLLVSNKKLILIDDIGNFKSKNIFRFNFLYHRKNIKKNKLVANLNNHTLPFKIIKNKFRKQVRKILILQGSSDPHNNLLNIYKTINKLIDCNKKIKFYFHLGLRNNNDKLLKFFINESKVKSNLFVTFNLTNLRVLYKNCDLSICAGGVTSIDMIYSRIPSIYVTNENKEILTSKLFSKYNFGIFFGKIKKKNKNNKLKLMLNELINDYRSRKKIYDNFQIIKNKKNFINSIVI